MKKWLPNLMTLGNLFAGCCALVYVLHGDLQTAAYFTAVCFLLDYGDGFAARRLGICGPLGKELDSLADVVSFGIVPGAILYHLLSLKFCTEGNPCTWAFPAFLLSAAAGLRLAKFNIDTRQTDYFLGLTTPGCTVFIMGLGLTVVQNNFGLAALLGQPWFILACVVFFSALMLSEIPMYGMKLKADGWRSNQTTLLGGLLGIVLLLLFKALGLCICVLLYILFSLLFFKKEKATQTETEFS